MVKGFRSGTSHEEGVYLKKLHLMKCNLSLSASSTKELLPRCG